jgi:hypothetical protein
VCFLNETPERPSYMWGSMTWKFKFCGFQIHSFLHLCMNPTRNICMIFGVRFHVFPNMEILLCLFLCKLLVCYLVMALGLSPHLNSNFCMCENRIVAMVYIFPNYVLECVIQSKIHTQVHCYPMSNVWPRHLKLNNWHQ